jgi:ectoine hydroxylase
MRLSQAQIQSYEKDGFLLLEDWFSREEIEALSEGVAREFEIDSPRRIMEKSGAVRSVFASHAHSGVFDCLSRLRRLIEPAMQLLGGEVYTHQFKINAKAALEGDQWEWHQDFLYWHKEDGMPEPRVLTAAVFLQDVNEFNGPMLLIPGSHKLGMIDLKAQAAHANAGDGFHDPRLEPPAWMSTLTADLKYKIDKEILLRLLENNSIYSVKGRAGFVLFFHGNLFHASTTNLSACDRMSIFISYNSAENKLPPIESPRPTFIASRDFTPIAPVNDDALLAGKQPGPAMHEKPEAQGTGPTNIMRVELRNRGKF